MAYNFNSDARYAAGIVGTLKEGLVVAFTQSSVYVQSGGGSFQTRYPNMFEKYLLPHVSSDKIVRAWSSNQMQFSQNQINFAAWCATTGCGVSVQDHLAASDPLMQSLYYFHVYYQMRRILDEMQTPLPQDRAWDAFDNPYDRRVYEQICSEFGISPHTNWHVKGTNNGLGRVYNYASGKGYRPVGGTKPARGIYYAAQMSFTKATTNHFIHVDFITQDFPDADHAWTTFILDKSEGFTKPGVERINDSIRTYVWAILGAQSQTRTNILGTGTAFDAQKQFLANVEDAISGPVDIPSAIARYQDVLRYARSKVDFAFGIGLYMAPSDMELRIGTIQDYNNEIVIAGPGQKLGINADINAAPSPPAVAVHDMEGPAARPVRPAADLAETTLPVPWTKPQVPTPEEKAEGQAHSDGLTALVVGVVALGLGWFALRQ